MLRQLSNLALAFSLVAGGWGYVLAAALCGHPDCAPFVASAGHGSHGSEAFGQTGERGPHEGHSKAGVERTAHDSSPGHCGRDPQGETSSADQSRFTSQRSPTSEPRSVQSASGEEPCGHCVGDAGPRDAADSVRQAERPQRHGVACGPPRTQTPPQSGFVRDVVPSQGAPPGRVSAHLLNSVFRI